MLRNYLNMTLKVLQRRKFYTFISMFGICITLTILLVVYAFWHHLTGAHGTEAKFDRSLLVFHMRVTENENSNHTGPVSFYFLDRYVRPMKTPEQMTFYSMFKTVNTYVDDKKVEMDLKYTDASFWEVMEFDFVEGRPYQETEVERSLPVVILNRKVKEQIFGQASAIGKEVEIYKERFRVVGVVENVPFTRIHSYGSIFLPYTLRKEDRKENRLLGDYMATLVAGDPSERKSIQAEFDAIVRQIENPKPGQITSIRTRADPYLASFTRMFMGDHENSGVSTIYMVLGLLMLLFMLLPTINLININISRIMERASEIGVRKAFGAASSALVVQFVLENIILTFICGLLSVCLAWLILEGINASNLIPDARLVINLSVLWIGLAVTMLFGLLSGVYPAWRMSRMQAAEALKIA